MLFTGPVSTPLVNQIMSGSFGSRMNAGVQFLEKYRESHASVLRIIFIYLGMVLLSLFVTKNMICFTNPLKNYNTLNVTTSLKF